jgi:RNA polymerase sigma factor (sigma-70 family)
MRRPGDSSADRISDQELLAGVRDGDRLSGEVLYERLVSTIDAALCKVMRCRDVDHEDLAQLAFEQVLVSLKRERFAEACSLRTWAALIARRVAYRALRARMRERGALGTFETDGGFSDGSEVALARLELSHAMETLLQMKPRRAEVVYLHDVCEDSLEEIARGSGVTLASVTNRLSRGRRELRSRLSSEGKRIRLRSSRRQLDLAALEVHEAVGAA